MANIECTKEQPWNGQKAKADRVRHHGAAEVRGSQENGWPGGDTVKMQCAFCGHSWEKELPQ